MLAVPSIALATSLCLATAPAAQPVVLVPPELVAEVGTPSDAFDAVLAGELVLVPDYASGLRIIDVSDPTSPSAAGTYDTPGYAIECAVAGRLVFVADHELGGLQVIDILDAASPRFVSSYVPGDAAVMVAWRDGIAAVGYLEGTLDFIDVSDPSRPVRVGTLDTPGAPRHAVFDGDFAYVADNGFGLLVLDVTDPSAPTLVGSVPGNRPVGLALAGEILCLADGANGLRTFDVTDPAAPQPLGQIALPGPAVKVCVAGGYAFVADHVAGGLQVVDVSSPSALTLITGYVTGNYAHGVAVGGEFAYLADGAGLKVLRVFASPLPVRQRTIGGVKAIYRRGGRQP